MPPPTPPTTRAATSAGKPGAAAAATVPASSVAKPTRIAPAEPRRSHQGATGNAPASSGNKNTVMANPAAGTDTSNSRRIAAVNGGRTWNAVPNATYPSPAASHSRARGRAGPGLVPRGSAAGPVIGRPLRVGRGRGRGAGSAA